MKTAAARHNSHPSRRQKSPARTGLLGGGVIAALVAAEAAAKEKVPAATDDAEAAPAAASLEDILDFAEICRTRASFGDVFGGHAHGRFTPRFAHHTDDHAFAWSRPAAGAAHDHDAASSPSGHGSHAPVAGLAGHEAHSDELTFAALAEHNEAHEVPTETHMHDLDAGLDALIGAHASHAAPAPADPGLVTVEAAALAEFEPVAVTASVTAAIAAATHQHHGGADAAALTPVIVTVEI
jgi:hypothetical protein